MEFIKKHYEKIVLGVVLLGSTAAVALLPFLIGAHRDKLTALKESLTHPKIKPLEQLDMSLEDAALQTAQTPRRLDFTTKHNLVNPVLWQRGAEGHPIKIATGNEIGVGAMEVTDIKPLYLRLSYDQPSANGYLIYVERQAATEPGKRSKRESFLTKDTKSDVVTLRNIKGPAEKPTELVMELNETGESISIGPTKTYERVEGHETDLKYGPDNKVWKSQRVGASLNFAGGQYNIVAITETNVVLSAKSNDKKTTLTFNSANPVTEPPR